MTLTYVKLNSDFNEDILGIFSNEEVLKYYGMEKMTTIDQANRLIDHFNKIEMNGIGFRRGILKDNQLIGTIGFHNWNKSHFRAEVGIEILPVFQRKGYAIEALTYMIHYGFEELGINRIGAIIYKENEASQQLFKRCGFEEEGLLRNYMHQEGKSYDCNSYSILKEIK